jgi:hypothetical protein
VTTRQRLHRAARHVARALGVDTLARDATFEGDCCCALAMLRAVVGRRADAGARERGGRPRAPAAQAPSRAR